MVVKSVLRSIKILIKYKCFQSELQNLKKISLSTLFMELTPLRDKSMTKLLSHLLKVSFRATTALFLLMAKQAAASLIQ